MGFLSFINFILLLKNIYISYKHCIESNSKPFFGVYDLDVIEAAYTLTATNKTL